MPVPSDAFVSLLDLSGEVAAELSEASRSRVEVVFHLIDQFFELIMNVYRGVTNPGLDAASAAHLERFLSAAVSSIGIRDEQVMVWIAHRVGGMTVTHLEFALPTLH